MDAEVEDKSMEAESPSSSDDEENELQLRAQELEQQLTPNMYLYDIHVELVELYRKMGDLYSMRSAYERFYKYFPLTPKLWLTWIKDEMKLAHSTADNKNILSLFDKAVEDYQSVKLWLEYVQFAIGSCTVEETRGVLERGLNAVGLHVAEGSLLWDTYREFEMAHLSVAEPESEQFKSQLHKVVEIFRRQLSVSLIDMENTYKEWEQFLSQLPEGHGINVQPIDWGYTKALKSLESYKPFEEQLVACENDADLYVIYKAYIKTIKDPSLIICLYERALVQLCLNPTLWEDYCYYSLKFGEISLKISDRSLRNCPWHLQLWLMRLRLSEHLEKPDKLILECFEEAIKSVSASEALDLWLAYIEYIKRKNDDTERLNKICEQAREQLSYDNDQSCKILRLQARYAAAKNNMPQARKFWSEVLKNPQNKSCGTIWIEYLSLERRYGEAKLVRNLFQRAIANCSDWQQYFADEWIMFEREVGTLQDMLNCLNECKKYVAHGDQQGNFPLSNNKKRNADDEAVKTQLKRQKTYDMRDKVRNNNYVKKSERMEPETVKNMQGPPPNMDPSKTVFVSNLNSKVDEDKLKELFSNSVQITMPRRRGASRCFAYVVFENDSDAQSALQRDREPLDGRPIFISECKLDRTQRQTVFKYSDKIEYNKLFVKGLPKHYTKDNIEAIFKPYSPTDIRLVNKFSGQFKGLAYVDFANEKDAESALKNTNEMTLDDCTITVAISAPPNKKDTFAPAPVQITRNSKSRLEIPFVPRSVQVKKSSDETVQNVSKTNDDFRKLLLNK